MKKNKILFLLTFILMMIFSTSIIYATSGKTSKCTHTVYSTNNTSTYHYYYCNICGKCNRRVVHSTNSVYNYRK